ncbi:hypothetical protein KHP60_09510 [Microvirga sp. 3-52]|uniref:hypothetical protein n=1 Tax=Microvirga sp. 3-52 TaxID=2792425 RepID=UPI001BCBA7AF|nr:hypothetical protein [Microvirga sp. 3-52]MBS7452572.1 hypothetical protein [Microvirga sp. 3-52]
MLRHVELTIADHFREQNEILRAHNQDQMEQIKRLTTGIERLVGEMHGLRTGKQEEAFARVAASDASADLPTVSAEAALIYVHTAKQIGEQLGFHPSQIGSLLGAKGLKWAGNGDYQEIGRTTSPSHPKFWHRDVPGKVRRILDESRPDRYGITDKSVLAIFRKWKERQASAELLEKLEPTPNPH